ncbi:hypothetical protein I79_018731 [Cricetulus griseus]|uniref:Uncharacterized protein n=1 Tax=Cricetulus griseus TaxID=10029 RepID=G3I5I3_CRIGR|nr:hypothetical protein I79_018731 [Cricetulus griseus]
MVQPQQKWEGVRPAACAKCTRVLPGISRQQEPHIRLHPSLSLGSWQNQLVLSPPISFSFLSASK